MTIILETERLQLRQLELADAPFMLALLNSPGWLAHIGDRGVTTVAQAGQYLQDGILKSYSEQGFGFWGIMRKNNPTLMGICGLIKRPSLYAPTWAMPCCPTTGAEGMRWKVLPPPLPMRRGCWA